MTENKWQGLGVSAGIRYGKAFVYKPLRMKEHEEQRTEDAEGELVRIQLAKTNCLSELQALVERTQQTLGDEKAAILKGQVSFLNDPTFYPPMEQAISNDSVTAETAVTRVVNQIAGLFESMANDYMRERAADVRDVGNRLMSHLVVHKGSSLSDIKEPVIIVTDDLTPSDTVQLDKKLVLGFITRVGGKTSHTAILANSLGISAILGVGDALDKVNHGDSLIMDGATGEWWLSPDDNMVEAYHSKLETETVHLQMLSQFANVAAVTKDGFQVEIAANIGTPEEAVGLISKGAEAVGLYRTEFLFMGESTMPDEEKQFRAYKAAAEAMKDKPVVIRTLDIGGDKELPYLDLPAELNPFLGYRAIRLCLDREDLLITQLRAILRASAYGNINIMFPMISGMEEWRQAKSIYEEARAQLLRDNIAVGNNVEVGIMIEIPSAALIADRLAKEVDFFSIGTNDLVQYTIAVDRMNEKVSYLYDYFHPSVIRLIKQVIDASRLRGKWTGMCGSMAGDRLAAPLLIGLGLHEWSMSPSAIPAIKQTITSLDKQACEALVERLLDMDTAAEIKAALIEFVNEAS